MVKKQLAILCIILFVVISCFLSVYENHIKNNVYYTKILKAQNYNYSKSTDTQKTSLNFIKYPEAKKYMDIDFKFKVDKFNAYGNIFQTSDVNDGIRFEINHIDNTGTLLFPDANDILSGISVGKVTPNVFHTVHIAILNNKIAVNFDGKIYTSDKNLGYFSINNIIVGQGFSPERFFNGEIKDFKIQYCAKKLSPKFIKNIQMTKNIFDCLSLLLLFYILSFYFKKISLNRAISISFICTILFLVCLNVFQYKTLYSDNFIVKEYDSQSSDSTINKPFLKAINYIPAKGALKEIDISFDFKIDHINQWDNIFQTADVNNGIRMELDKNGYAGLVCLKKSSVKKMLGFDLGKFEKNKIYKVRIIKNAGKNLKISLNNNSFKTLNYVSDDFEVNNISVGQGFDNTRTFNGQIKNFKVKYKCKISSEYKKNIFQFLSLISFITFILTLLIKIIKSVKINQEKYSFKILFYLLILNLYPILSLYLTNINELYFYSFISFTTKASLYVIIAYTCLFKLLKKDKLFISLIVFMIYFYISGLFYASLSKYVTVNPLLYVQILSIIAIYIIYLVINSKTDYTQMIKSIKIMSLLLIVLTVISHLSGICSSVKLALNNKNSKIESTPNDAIEKTDKTKPDIWFIILDAYINSNIAKNNMNFDNTDFVNALKEKGYYFVDKSMANYGHTLYSVPSMLNCDYLNNLGLVKEETMETLGAKVISLYKKSKFIKTIYDGNYKIYYVNMFPKELIADSFDVPSEMYSFNETKNKKTDTFKIFVMEQSILFYKSNDSYGVQDRLKTLQSFEALNKISEIKESRPKFVFSHIKCPHYPYVFNKNGEMPNRYEMRTDKTANSTVYPNNKSYFEQILYLNKIVLDLSNNILKNNPNSVIILISDHGQMPTS
ncbi:sulfatase-like hydrolase/transferase, partial [bacterium]|nr:sulfatase-like hydrolase/transferase [bacterium]